MIIENSSSLGWIFIFFEGVELDGVATARLADPVFFTIGEAKPWWCTGTKCGLGSSDDLWTLLLLNT